MILFFSPQEWALTGPVAADGTQTMAESQHTKAMTSTSTGMTYFASCKTMGAFCPLMCQSPVQRRALKCHVVQLWAYDAGCAL